MLALYYGSTFLNMKNKRLLNLFITIIIYTLVIVCLYLSTPSNKNDLGEAVVLDKGLYKHINVLQSSKISSLLKYDTLSDDFKGIYRDTEKKHFLLFFNEFPIEGKVFEVYNDSVVFLIK